MVWYMVLSEHYCSSRSVLTTKFVHSPSTLRCLQFVPLFLQSLLKGNYNITKRPWPVFRSTESQIIKRTHWNVTFFRFSFTNEDSKVVDISFGKDDNEVCVTGQSAMQFPQEYTFEKDNETFHLIDTPGIGDSSGIEQDKQSFANTLDFLTCYDKTNVVVVLLKPNSGLHKSLGRT